MVLTFLILLIVSAEHEHLRVAMNQMNALHRVEMDSAQGVVSVLKSRLEQKLEETKKLERIISGAYRRVSLCLRIDNSEALTQPQPTKPDQTLQPGQIKEYCALKEKIDATREKIETLLTKEDKSSNGSSLKLLFEELNDCTVRLLNNLVKQLSEERHYSSGVLHHLTAELLHVDLLIETIQSLSQQTGLAMDDRRVTFSFVVPETAGSLSVDSSERFEMAK